MQPKQPKHEHRIWICAALRLDAAIFSLLCFGKPSVVAYISQLNCLSLVFYSTSRLLMSIVVSSTEETSPVCTSRLLGPPGSDCRLLWTRTPALPCEELKADGHHPWCFTSVKHLINCICRELVGMQTTLERQDLPSVYLPQLQLESITKTNPSI